MIHRLCIIALVGYGILCLLSLTLIPLSQIGALGIQPDPLSGIFAYILGMPWSLLTARWASDTHVGLNILLISGCMLTNGMILWGCCRWFRRQSLK